jgi:hypothetical protein
MTFRGQVKGGVIVLDGEARLAEGAIVCVEVVTTGPAVDAARSNDLERMADLAVETGVPDLATNIDHYLYGHPKVSG